MPNGTVCPVCHGTRRVVVRGIRDCSECGGTGKFVDRECRSCDGTGRESLIEVCTECPEPDVNQVPETSFVRHEACPCGRHPGGCGNRSGLSEWEE